MACATLKRNLDWESMAQLPAKRRRCAPFAASSSTSPGIKMTENKPSTFGDSVTAPVKLTPERMAQEICDEIKRLQRRRQLRLASGAAASCSSSSGSEGDCSPPHRSSHNSQKVHNRALFTFKQVTSCRLSDKGLSLSCCTGLLRYRLRHSSNSSPSAILSLRH
ncbi:hypothetical protein evm_008112 [Chilo suppressalis]|nr:hypothetical protein evm_008112 [Chilo suppressalis]